MTTVRRGAILAGIAVLVPLAFWQLARSADPPTSQPGRFAFQVVESFDAKYLGDTPGHIGRGGGLGEGKPDVALGDTIYRGDEKIGTVSSLTWDRSKGSLEVEFDPVPMRVDAGGRNIGPLRIAVGDEVWMPLGGRPAAAEKKGR